MHWILIIWIAGQPNHTPATVPVEFPSLQSCEASGKAWRERSSLSRYFCLPVDTNLK